MLSIQQFRGPPATSWLTKAPVTIVIRTINHSYWSYAHQLSYRTGASHCRNRSMTISRVPELDEGETRQEAPNIWLKPGVEP